MCGLKVFMLPLLLILPCISISLKFTFARICKSKYVNQIVISRKGNFFTLKLPYMMNILIAKAIPGGVSGKESAHQCRRCKRRGFDPWVRKIPWRRKWQPTPVFLPGEPPGQRSLVGYSSWGHRELDITERLSMHAFTPNLNLIPPYS